MQGAKEKYLLFQTYSMVIESEKIISQHLWVKTFL